MLETILNILLYGFALLGVFWTSIILLVGYYLHKDEKGDSVYELPQTDR